MKRREFLQRATAAASMVMLPSFGKAFAESSSITSTNEFDFLVVGSGPGGAPLAVRLAQQGYSVGLIEAGSWATSALVEVPAYHALASEWDPVTWRFYVQHYTNEFLNRKDPKYNEQKKGVFYPRGSAVGGSSVVNAMISMMPSRFELDDLARSARDRQLSSPVWEATFDRVSKCYDVGSLQFRPSQYLESRSPSKWTALKDRQFLEIIRAVFKDEQVPEAFQGKIYQALLVSLSPNNKGEVQFPRVGPFITPINSTAEGKRWSARNLLQRALENPQIKNKLQIIDQTLVTKLDLVATADSERRYRCQGVYAMSGQNLYGAGVGAQPQSGKPCYFKAKKEVILSGGAFNSPQMLQISGVGDPEHLKKIGLETIVPLPMVGKNLQDRYEVSVVSELPQTFSLLQNCDYNRAIEHLEKSDMCFQDYEVNDVSSVYSTNGVIIGLKKIYKTSERRPDLFIFGLPGEFRGYSDGYSKKSFQPNKMSWVILKGYTENQSGQVLSSSADPFTPPQINFKYFEDGTRLGDDYAAVEMGLQSVRKLNQRLAEELGAPVKELYPAEKNLSDYIQYESWGHHASCSNKMGSKPINPWTADADSVVDSNFRVHGVAGLRVVDASVFPRIPGLFIGLPTFLLSEIAADKILQKPSLEPVKFKNWPG